MTAAISKLPPPAMAVLAIAALWWLSQRRAVGGTVRPWPVYGTEGALQNKAVQAYRVPPSGVLPASASPLQGVLSLASGLFNRTPSASSVALEKVVSGYGQGGPSLGYYGSTNNPSFTSPGQTVRPDGYDPAYIPDAAGESQAQLYVLNNPTEFLSNPPPVYAYNSGVDNSGGWLDNQ